MLERAPTVADPYTLFVRQYEGGEPCSVCGHRLQHSSEAPAAAPAIVPAPILQGFLYLGSYDVASRSELLKAMSITHILNVSVGLRCCVSRTADPPGHICAQSPPHLPLWRAPSTIDDSPLVRKLPIAGLHALSLRVAVLGFSSFRGSFGRFCVARAPAFGKWRVGVGLLPADCAIQHQPLQELFRLSRRRRGAPRLRGVQQVSGCVSRQYWWLGHRQEGFASTPPWLPHPSCSPC